MKWSNIWRNKCPACNKDLARTLDPDRAPGTIACKCGFKISESKYQLIASDRTTKNLSEAYDEDKED